MQNTVLTGVCLDRKLARIPGVLDPPDDRWEHWLVHLLWSTSTRTSALAETVLAESPLTLAGLGLLENVNARPGITVAGIARRAPQTQQTLSQIASRLEKLGLVERKLVPGDRGIGLFLTAQGAEVRARAHEATEQFEQSMCAALGKARYERLVRLLEDAEATMSVIGSDSEVFAAHRARSDEPSSAR